MLICHSVLVVECAVSLSLVYRKMGVADSLVPRLY